MSRKTKLSLIHDAYAYALKLLSRPAGWVQEWGVDKNGSSVDRDDAVMLGSDLKSMCLLTALPVGANHVGCNKEWVTKPVIKELKLHDEDLIPGWNDEDGRKKKEVTDLLARLRDKFAPA